MLRTNDHGYPIGEDHWCAKLTDHDCALMIQMRENEGTSYGQLAKIFECSKTQARNICTGRERQQTTKGWRPAEVKRQRNPPADSTGRCVLQPRVVFAAAIVPVVER